jgi:hypothetical protein
MSKNSVQQNLNAFQDWKDALERKRKMSGKRKPLAKKTKMKYHPALEYNEDGE